MSIVLLIGAVGIIKENFWALTVFDVAMVVHVGALFTIYVNGGIVLEILNIVVTVLAVAFTYLLKRRPDFEVDELPPFIELAMSSNNTSTRNSISTLSTTSCYVYTI